MPTVRTLLQPAMAASCCARHPCRMTPLGIVKNMHHTCMLLPVSSCAGLLPPASQTIRWLSRPRLLACRRWHSVQHCMLWPVQTPGHDAWPTTLWSRAWPAGSSSRASGAYACLGHSADSPEAVLPFSPGSVSVTSRSTVMGGSTLITCTTVHPLWTPRPKTFEA